MQSSSGVVGLAGPLVEKTEIDSGALWNSNVGTSTEDSGLRALGFRRMCRSRKSAKSPVNHEDK